MKKSVLIAAILLAACNNGEEAADEQPQGMYEEGGPAVTDPENVLSDLALGGAETTDISAEDQATYDNELEAEFDDSYTYSIVDNATGCHYISHAGQAARDGGAALVPRMVRVNGHAEHYCGQVPLKPLRTRKQIAEEEAAANASAEAEQNSTSNKQ